MKLISARKQSGVALIIALMITTMAISLASIAMYRQQIQIRLTGNMSSLEQAYQYAEGMEDWSKKILEQDYKDNPKVDSEKEDWHTKLPPIPIEGGLLIGQLFDLQGRLNLNSVDMVYPKLKKPKPKAGEKKDKKDKEIKTEPLVYERFTALIASIDSEQTLGPPENFVDTLWDWIDKKDEEREGGAESSYYQSLETPYMSANTPLMDVSELRLLKGVTREIFEQIKPLVSTLPKDTKININTAPKEVLEAIGFNTEVTQAIIKVRDETPFEKLNDFWNIPEVKTLFAAGTEKGKKKRNYEQTLTVTSHYFLLQGSVSINNTRIFINSILHRKKGKVRVISRDYSNP
jgi:general secretion pathway protein K